MKVVISLVTYNSAHYLERCLTSIRAQSFQAFQLVCRDSNSRDESIAEVARCAPDARIIRSDMNDGFSRAHNAVIRDTTSDYVCVLNPDLVLDPSYLQVCIDFLDAYPSAGSVSGLLMRVPALTEQPTSDIIDSSGLVVARTFRCANANAGKPSSAIQETARVIGVPATAAVYRRSALEDVALDGEYFDEDFFMYKEDVDLAFRLAARGWESYVLPQASAYHIRSTSPRTFVRPSSFINRLSYRNHWYLLIKNMSWPLFTRCGLWIIGYELAKVAYLFFREPQTLGAIRTVWHTFPRMKEKRALIIKKATADVWPLMSH